MSKISSIKSLFLKINHVYFYSYLFYSIFPFFLISKVFPFLAGLSSLDPCLALPSRLDPDIGSNPARPEFLGQAAHLDTRNYCNWSPYAHQLGEVMAS